MQIQTKLVPHKHHVQRTRAEQVLSATVAGAFKAGVQPRTRPSFSREYIVAFQHESFQARKPKEHLQVLIVSVPARLIQVAGDHAFELVQDDALERRQLVNDTKVAIHRYTPERSPSLANFASAIVGVTGVVIGIKGIFDPMDDDEMFHDDIFFQIPGLEEETDSGDMPKRISLAAV